MEVRLTRGSYVHSVLLAHVASSLEEAHNHDRIAVPKRCGVERAVADFKGFHGGGYESFVAGYGSIFC